MNSSRLLRRFLQGFPTLLRQCKVRTVHYLPIMSTGKMHSPDFKALLKPELLNLERLFKSAGYDFRFVGGVVRDLLLGVPPKDVDIGTDCEPNTMIRMLRKAGIRCIPTGLNHGTVTVVLKDGITYEITTLREDQVTDGRHAKVNFVRDWKTDALRRDLTINAMSLSLDGILYDYFQGEKHLAEKSVLFVGDARKRIMEDYLRILRYFRFYGRIVPKADRHDRSTLEAIQELAEGLEVVSAERIWNEMAKILMGNHAPHLIQLMYKLGVAKHIRFHGQPNLVELERVWSAMKSRGGDPLKSSSLLSSLTHTTQEFLQMAESWKLSNKERDQGAFIVDHRETTYDPSTPCKYYQDLLVMSTDRGTLLELLRYCDRFDYYSTLETWVVPKMPVNGRDLMEGGLVSPGHQMGWTLKCLKQQWMESGYTLNKEDLMGMVPQIKEEFKEDDHLQRPQQKKKKMNDFFT